MAGEAPPGTRLLEQAEHYIYLATAFLLVIAAAALLAVAASEMVQRIAKADYIGGLLQLLDRTLLVLMLAEIIYTVRTIADRGKLVAQPFFIVAIIAAIRRIVVVTAESTRTNGLSDPAFQATLAELGLLAIVVLLLATAMKLIPEAQSPGLDD